MGSVENIHLYFILFLFNFLGLVVNFQKILKFGKICMWSHTKSNIIVEPGYSLSPVAPPGEYLVVASCLWNIAFFLLVRVALGTRYNPLFTYYLPTKIYLRHPLILLY